MELNVHVFLFPQSFKFQTYNDVGRFRGGAGLLGAVENLLICNQWERKGMKTDINFSG